MKKWLDLPMIAAIQAMPPAPARDPLTEKQLRYEELMRLRRMASAALVAAEQAVHGAQRAVALARSAHAEIKVGCEILEEDLGIERDGDEHESAGHSA